MKKVLFMIMLSILTLSSYAASACCPSSKNPENSMTLIQNGQRLLLQADFSTQNLSAETKNQTASLADAYQKLDLIVLQEKKGFFKKVRVQEKQKKIDLQKSESNQILAYEKNYQDIDSNKEYILDFSELFENFPNMKSLQLTALIQNQQKEWTLTPLKSKITW